MEIKILEDDSLVKLTLNVSSRQIIIQRKMGQVSVPLYGTTGIFCTEDGHLLIGALRFSMAEGHPAASSITEIQEFANQTKAIVQSRLQAARSQNYGDDYQQLPNAGLAHYRRAASAAILVERIALGFTVLSVAGGLFFAFQRDPNCWDDCTIFERYPNIFFGALIGIHGAVFMMSLAMVASYVRGSTAEKGA